MRLKTKLNPYILLPSYMSLPWVEEHPHGDLTNPYLYNTHYNTKIENKVSFKTQNKC